MFTFTNTHIVVPEFDFVEPRTLEEVTAALAECGDQARLMAGGSDLLVGMKLERHRPTRILSLHRIAALKRLECDGDLQIGATASIRSMGSAAPIRERYTAIAEACHAFSTVQIMFMATVGGNLCNASPAADTAPPLLVFDARARLGSASGTREVPIDGFFTGPGRTVVNTGELLESVHVPAPAEPSGSAFLKVARVAADISKVCVAVKLVREAAWVRECRIALGAVAPTPCRAFRAEATLVGERLTVSAVNEAARLAREEIEPITDVRSTAAYRRHVAGVLVRDAIGRAWMRAAGGEIS